MKYLKITKSSIETMYIIKRLRGLFFMYVFLAQIPSLAISTTSITDDISSYKQLCLEASVSDEVFTDFRRQFIYRDVVETVPCSLGSKFTKYIMKTHPNLLTQFELFRKTDLYGAPITYQYIQPFGNISPCTLRYIAIAGDIAKLFNFSRPPKVVEIGGGYGGQCFVMNIVSPFSKYTIIDLPEVLPLQKKYLDLQAIKKVDFLPYDFESIDKDYDLVISNYAFSECSDEYQSKYFHEVVKHSKCGYLTINFFSDEQIMDFVSLLKENGINPVIARENVVSCKGNYVVYWNNN